MEFLGIGPIELLFILFIALILLGPKDMAKTGRTIGRTLRKVVTSPQWQTINQTSKELRNLPTRLIREAGLEEVEQDLNNLKKTTADIQKSIRDSTILPPGWDKAGTTNPKNPAVPKNHVESSPTEGRSAGNEEPGNRPTSSTPPQTDGPDLSPWITPPVVIPSPPPPTNPDSSEPVST